MVALPGLWFRLELNMSENYRSTRIILELLDAEKHNLKLVIKIDGNKLESDELKLEQQNNIGIIG